ncbi:MAG TPA: arsenite methyltransferase [Anaerolinea sp.]|nr:arsenite methyltransferase [Anaerolinea sp.]
MTMTQASSDYFEQVAGSWDQISAGYFGQPVRDAAFAKSYLRPEMHVADVGAGTGFVAAGLAPLVRRVYVVDGSSAMLVVAKKNLDQFDNVEYHLADGAHLPFPDEMLDAVFANMYLHHTPDPAAAIREMVRVLRPGGRLVITDMETHPYAWLKEEMADVWQGFERAQVRGWLQQAGLVNTLVDCTGQSCCAEAANPVLTDAQGREARISIFVATGTRRMVMRDAVRENYAAVARSHTSCGCSSPETSNENACCGESDCCSGSSYEEVTFATGYTNADLSAAPQEAAQISLGCGNPIAMAGMRPGEVVLDIGSGGGLDAFLAAQRVGPGGRVIGVDMTPDMLERARASAERNHFDNVEFRQGYAEELPVEDGVVDVIISNCVINLTEDKGRVFQEAFRVLKPGGRLEVSDVVTAGPVPIELRESAEGWSECVTGALPEQEYLDLIAQAGFEQVTTRRSASTGEVYGIPVYSVIASARKPAAEPSSGCGCGSNCGCGA